MSSRVAVGLASGRLAALLVRVAFVAVGWAPVLQVVGPYLLLLFLVGRWAGPLVGGIA